MPSEGIDLGGIKDKVADAVANRVNENVEGKKCTVFELVKKVYTF